MRIVKLTKKSVEIYKASKTIFINDLDKFEQNIDQSMQYNKPLYTRLEKDVYYLRDDQDNVRRRMLVMEKRIVDME